MSNSLDPDQARRNNTVQTKFLFFQFSKMRLPSPKNSPQIIRVESTIPLHEYIFKNDVKNVKASVTEHDVNATDSKGRSALFLAASLNRYELIEVLLTSGSDINVSDPLGNTALHEAAEKGHTDIVRMLAKHGKCTLTLKGSLTTKFVCFCRLLKCFTSLYNVDPDQTDMDPRCLLLCF